MHSVKQACRIFALVLNVIAWCLVAPSVFADGVMSSQSIVIPSVSDSILLDQGVDANLPELGDTSQTVLSAQDEQQIAEQILRQVAVSDEVIQDAEVTDYVRGLGYRLAQNGPSPSQPFHFFVVKDSTINAFAMPGGVIGVHTGLILASKSESELAGVLGHEIGHVTQHHLARMLENQKKGTLKNVAGIALALLVARANPQLAQGALTASTAYGVQMQLDYTRAHEREADRVGLQILNNAGFDVRGMPSFFNTLQRGNRFSEGSAPGFLRTHPLTVERISDVSNRVAQMPYKQVTDGLDYQLVRAKLRAIGSFLDTNASLSSREYFKENLDQNRSVNPVVDYYGLAVSNLQLRQLDDAGKAIDWLMQNAQPHPMLANLKAYFYAAKGDAKQAAEAYLDGLGRYPTYRALIYGYADLLMRTQQVARLVSFLEQKSTLLPEDAKLYLLKSRAYAAQNKQLLSHHAQGEAYYRQYDLNRAVEQMQIAARSSDGDFYQRSIVEARLKQMQHLLKLKEVQNGS